MDSIGKYVWAISMKHDTLWLGWIHDVYIRDATWWDYKPQSGVSWYCRKIFSVKEQLKQVMTQQELDQMNTLCEEGYDKLVEDHLNWGTIVWNRLNCQSTGSFFD